MELKHNKTPKFLIWVAVIVFSFLVFAVTDANYNMLLRVTQEKQIGERNPFGWKDEDKKNAEIKRLYNTFTIEEKTKAMAKALGYSLATLLIVVYYKSYAIKVFFVSLDSAIIFIYLNKSYEAWWRMSSYVYAIYTGLILFFVGLIATEIIREITERKETEIKLDILEPFKQKINEVIIAQNNTDKAFKDYISKQEKVLEIDRQINARKAKLRRDNKDWREDQEVNELVNEKNSL